MRSGWGAVPAGLLALVLVFAPDRVDASSYGLARQRVSLGDWRLTVAADRFSGERRCRLAIRKGTATYSRGIVSIRLPRIVNLSEAVIRVNGGAPKRWRDLVPELARLDPGFASDRDPWTLPVPAELLKGAPWVHISPAYGKRARGFRVAEFDSALERAVALGCRPDAAFVG